MNIAGTRLKDTRVRIADAVSSVATKLYAPNVLTVLCLAIAMGLISLMIDIL